MLNHLFNIFFYVYNCREIRKIVLYQGLDKTKKKHHCLFNIKKSGLKLEHQIKAPFFWNYRNSFVNFENYLLVKN